LTDLSSRHSVLTKQKIVKDKPRIQSNSGKLTNWLTTGTSEQPMVIAEDTGEPIIIRVEDDESMILNNIPEAGGNKDQARRSTRNKRRRGDASEPAVSEASDSDDSFAFESAPSTKRPKANGLSLSDADHSDDEMELQDDKKKLSLNTSYDGFSIYGRILCLIVKRKGVRNPASGSGAISSQHMMENWVSTQAAGEGDDDD
jgi:hypothetical protein